MTLPERIARVLELEPESAAIEFKGKSYPWRFISSATRKIDAELARAGVSAGDGVGVMGSNRPTTVAALAALLVSRRPAVFFNPSQPASQLAAELSTLRVRALIADAAEWQAGPVPEALRAVGTVGLVMDGENLSLYPGLEKPGVGPFMPNHAGIALIQTTSGTTGPPKRVYKRLAQVEEALAIGHPSGKNENDSELKLKRSPTMAFKSLAHSGGVTAVMLALYEARPISLHEKFRVEEWVASVRSHRPKVTSLVPAMLRMLWDADVPREALQSLIAIRVGTAPLDPEFQKNFEEKYGVPLLIDYGGTEIGGVTGWSLDDHRKYGAAKRGSVGRLKRGISVRVVDDATGAEVPRGEAGLLEVKNPQLGPDWIRTTDLVALDADGFLYVRGRADGAINRGGFKVLPETIGSALRRHDLVGDAAVVGMADPRLGEVPVAFVEPRPRHASPAPEDLLAHLRATLTPYEVPVAIHVLASLPRTPSLKVNLAELKALSARAA